MSDLDGNLEDRFSHNKAKLSEVVKFQDTLSTETVSFFVDCVSIQIVYNCQKGAGSSSLNGSYQH